MQYEYHLPQEWVDYMINQPETGMGYQEVDIYFSDKTLTDVIVYNCEHFYSYDDKLNLDDIVDMSDVHEGKHAWNQPIP